MKITKPNKKTLIITAIILGSGLIVIGGSVAMLVKGAHEWTAKANASTVALRDLKRDVKKLSSDQTPKERREVVSRLSLNNDTVNCKGSWWYNWQADYLESGRDAKKVCTLTLEKITTLQRSLGALNQYFTEEESIVLVLQTLRIDASQPDWQVKAKQSIAKAKQDLAKDSFKSDDGKKVLAEAQARVGALEVSWAKLDAASEKQDKTTYMASLAELKQAYADMTSIADVSDTSLLALIADVASHLKDK